ncbi:hypothetical protein [Rugosimonospora acidiphila]|uniref:hypothetical protein n=1 Tax=Rugosimonospora acidiphila TaxID=556531 RepID=UPI0031E5F9BD
MEEPVAAGLGGVAVSGAPAGSPSGGGSAAGGSGAGASGVGGQAQRAPSRSEASAGQALLDRVLELVPGHRTRLPLIGERRVERCANGDLVRRVAS